MHWRVAASRYLTRVGEHLKIDSIVYRPGVMKLYDSFAQRDAPGFTSRLFEVFGPVRYLDVGAGTGRYAERLRALGAPADACEYGSAGRRIAAERGLDVLPLDLASPIPGPSPSNYDVAFCLEVAEHVSPELGDLLVAYLAGFPTVVFTAAPPGQGGTGHINEQPKRYWENRFAVTGHQRSRSLELRFAGASGDVPGDYLLSNLMIFVPGGQVPIADGGQRA